MRYSNLGVLLLVLLVGVLIGGVALGEEKNTEQDEAKKLSGKDLYKNHCKSCHKEDSEFGEYTPMSLIMDQWDEFFDEQFVPSHKDVVDEKYDGKKVTDIIDKDMIKKLRKFCVDHAADSEEPMTCG